jgi:hypothetical protein
MVTIKATRESDVRGNARLTNDVVAPQPLPVYSTEELRILRIYGDDALEPQETLACYQRIFAAESTFTENIFSGVADPQLLPVHSTEDIHERIILSDFDLSSPDEDFDDIDIYGEFTEISDDIYGESQESFTYFEEMNSVISQLEERNLSQIIVSAKRQKYLDTLYQNTNSIDLIERKYLESYAKDFNVQSGIIENIYSYCTPHFDEKFLVKLIEDIIYFIDLSCEKVEGKSRTHTIIRAATIFLKLRFNESLFHLIKDRAIPFITKIFGDFEVQSGDFISSARELLNTYKNINDSPIMIKLYKCTMYIMSLSIFEKIGISLETLGYTSLEKAAMKKKYYKKSDFLYVLFDTALFIAERGYQVYITRDPMSLFHSGGEYKLIFETCSKLKRWSLLLSNPEEHGFTESEFRLEVDHVIEKLENISKHSFRLDKTDINMIKSELNNMLMIRDEMNTKSAAKKNRKAPFGVLIYGDSGIGKTSITAILTHYYAKKMQLPLGPEACYTRNSADPFWSNFNSSVHTVILDDVANQAPEMQDPASVNEIIQIMNNQAFCPNQAELEAKGRTPFRAKLVVATTNVKNLNAYHYFSCPSAVQRRFPFIITPRVREEYKDERGMLNSSKLQDMDLGPYPDIWLFNIELVRPVPLTEGKRWAKMEMIKENISLKELLIWYRDAIDTFNLDQHRVEKSLNVMRACEFCLCCGLPETLCQRLQVQSNEVVSNEFYMYLCVLFTMIWYVLIKIYKSQTFIDVVYYYKMYVTYKNNKMRIRELTYNYYRRISNIDNWQAMGERMQLRLSHPKALLSLASMLATSFTLYKIATRFSTEPQSGESEAVGTTPVAELNGRENVWYNNTLDLSSADFTRQSASSKSMEFTDFCKKVAKNVAYIEIRRPNTNNYIRARMVCLGGHVWMSNNHNVPPLDASTTIKVVIDGKIGISCDMTFVLSQADVHRVPDKDLVFLTLRELPPMKKIIQYFQIGDSNGVFNGAYVSKSTDGKVDINTSKKITLCKERSFKFPKHNIDSTVSCWKNYPSTHTTAGYCGSPLIINSSYGYSIVGLHFLASNASPEQSYSTSVDGKLITEIYNSLTPYNVESGDFTLVSSSSAKRVVTDLHKKSVFRYLNGGAAHVYGSFTDFRGKSKSSVVNTPMSNILKDHGYDFKYTKPEMRSWVPWHIAAKDLVKPICTLDTGILNLCVESYISDVMSSIDPQIIKDMLMPLDNFTAINGAQVAYIDKINRNTSAGNPWKKSKKYFMVSVPEEHGMPDPVKVDDEIMKRVDEIIETYLSGKQAHPNFCAHLKDEPVTFKKARIGKTRVFTGASFDWTIVVRKFLLSFARLQQNERFAFESAPGTIAQSLEWEELYEYIVKHGDDRIVAGDYKAYDKRMTPKETLAAFDIIIFFCELSGNYTKDEILVIRGIAEDMAFALVDFNGDLLQLLGSNPSGHPLTVVINGLVNSLRMRYAFFKLAPPGFTGGFKENVSLMTYGDDNIMSVHKSCDWYNHTAISGQFAALDIVYTMADKEAESVPFINIKDASFLKREWKYNSTVGCMLAPLDHDSIEKMLMTWCQSKSVCSEAQGISVITTALREYFYYGEDIYNEKLILLQSVVKKLGWELFVEESTFLSYNELINCFKIASKRCKSYNKIFKDTSFEVQSDICYFDDTTGFENVLEQTQSIPHMVCMDQIILEFLTQFWMCIGLVYLFTMKRFTFFNTISTMCVICNLYGFISHWIYLITFMYFVLQTKRCICTFLSIGH